MFDLCYLLFVMDAILNLCSNCVNTFVASAADSQFHFEHAPRISIKIVEELPSNDNGIGIGFNAGGHFEADLSDAVKERSKKITLHPVPFSGPEQLKKLEKVCFTYLAEKYKYKFCPFNNITQEEVQGIQEPYRAVLGVWGEWIIEHNTFKAMHFLKGMNCGPESERNVKVNLSCGAFNRLVKVTEPTKCKYEGLFETPLVCGPGSLLVYPRLTKELQLEWDRIETEKFHDILTQKGYDEELNQMFLKAGYILSPSLKNEISHQVTVDDSGCEESKKALQLKVEQLEKELASKVSLIRILKEEIKEEPL